MRIIVDFTSWDEMEAFRTSGKKTRGKGKDEPEEAPPFGTAAAPQGGQPVMPANFASAGAAAPAVGFTAPDTAMQGFPGAAPAPASAVNPLVGQIVAKLDSAIASGQNPDGIAAWFRNLLGADAAQATLDQIKQVFIPRLPEPQLKQLAMQVGINPGT